MRTYRIGVEGLGNAGTAQVKAFQKHPRARVVAIHSRSAERRAAATRDLGVENAVESYDALLDSGIDVAVICTPDQIHREYVLKAIDKGVHVLCEKPLATTIQDIRAVVRAARNSGKIFMTGQCARFFDRSQFARQLIDRGELGEVFFAESDYLHDIREYLRGWRVDPKSPQDMVLGGGCHPLDLLRWYLGDVETVHAVANRKSLPPDCPIRFDCMLLSLKFASGAIGKVLVSVGCRRPYSLGLSLYGTEGTLVDERFYLSRYAQFEDFMDAKLPKHSHDVNTIFERQAAHLIDCLDRGEQPIADVVEGAKTAATCLAGIESIRTGKPVRVPDVS